MNNEQLERYARHISLDEVGEVGQQKLLDSKVLVIGAGGLGSPALMYLTASGVGTIGIADNDYVDFSNLQRQIIHLNNDVENKKIRSAEARLKAMNPDVKINTYFMRVDKYNIMDLIKDYDFILDCTDNFETKFLINDACVIAKKPFSHAGILRFEGQVMTYVPNQGACYRCIFKNPPPPDVVPTVREAGVIGAVCGITGTLQALEAIKYILGKGELLNGYMLCFNALTMQFRKIKLPTDNHNCSVCGDKPSITSLY